MSTLNTIMTALGYIVAFAAIVLLISFTVRQYEKVEDLEKLTDKSSKDIYGIDNRCDALEERIARLEARSQGDDGK